MHNFGRGKSGTLAVDFPPISIRTFKVPEGSSPGGGSQSPQIHCQIKSGLVCPTKCNSPPALLEAPGDSFLGCKWIFTLATLQATHAYFCDTAFWNNMCCERTNTDVTTKADGVPGCTLALTDLSETKNVGTRSSSQQAALVMWNRMFFL